MPTMTLTLDGIGVAGGGWSYSGAGSLAQAISSDDGNNSYGITSTLNDALIGLSFTDPIVAEGDIDSITSVRWVAKGRRPSRTAGGTDVSIVYNLPSGFTENINFPSAGSMATVNGTTRTTQPDGSDWTYSRIVALLLNLVHKDTATLWLTYIAVEVVYVEAVAADDAVFFGTNF